MKKRKEKPIIGKIIKKPKGDEPEWVRTSLYYVDIPVIPILQGGKAVKELKRGKIAQFKVKVKELIKALRKSGWPEAADWYAKNRKQEYLFFGRSKIKI